MHEAKWSKDGSKHVLVCSTQVSCSVQEMWDFHADVQALRLLTPPGKNIELQGEETKVRPGAIHRLKIRQGPLTLRWDALIQNVDPPHGFCDVAVRSPFKSWRHHHRFLAGLNASSTELRDEVELEIGFWMIPAWPFIKRDIESMFRHRHQVTAARFDHATKSV